LAPARLDMNALTLVGKRDAHDETFRHPPLRRSRLYANCCPSNAAVDTLTPAHNCADFFTEPPTTTVCQSRKSAAVCGKRAASRCGRQALRPGTPHIHSPGTS